MRGSHLHLVWLVAGLCACGPPISTLEVHKRLVSVAPAPRGPVLSGRAGQAGDVRLGGAVAWTMDPQEPDAQDPAAGSRHVPVGWGQGWVGVGLGYGLEAFAAGGASFSANPRADTADPPFSPPGEALGYGELGVRVMADLRGGGVGGTVSVRLTQLRVAWDVTTCTGEARCETEIQSDHRESDFVASGFLVTLDAYARLATSLDFVVSVGLEAIPELPTTVAGSRTCFPGGGGSRTRTCQTSGTLSGTVTSDDADFIYGVILRPGLVLHLGSLFDLQLMLSPITWRVGRPLQYFTAELGVELHL